MQQIDTIAPRLGGGLHLRSGAPKQTPTARILTPIDSVAQIKEISFSYQYISGFSNGKLPSTFELWIQDEAGKDAAGPIYTSPPLGEYMYEKCNHCYSPKTLVDVQGCPKCKALLNTPHYFAIRFTNNDRNVQLKLPLEIQIGHNDTLMFLWIFLACIGMYLGVGTLHGTVVKKKKVRPIPRPVPKRTTSCANPVCSGPCRGPGIVENMHILNCSARRRQ